MTGDESQQGDGGVTLTPKHPTRTNHSNDALNDRITLITLITLLATYHSNDALNDPNHPTPTNLNPYSPHPNHPTTLKQPNALKQLNTLTSRVKGVG